MTDDREMPTSAEWSAAGEQMHDLQQVGFGARWVSAIRHWWASRMGDLRNRIRAWLGIDQAENDLLEVTEVTLMVNGLRRDLDAVADTLNQSNDDGNAKLNLTTSNVAELARQFRVVADLVDSHAVLLKAWRGVPILAKASTAALKHQQEVAKVREELKRLASEPGDHPKAD